MQRPYLPYLLSLLMLLSMGACSGSHHVDPAEAIDEIENLVYIGDFNTARLKADELSADTTAVLTTRQLCRMSIVYMKMSDLYDTDINTALATRFYRMAINSDIDTANAFYETLPLDESRHVDLMSKLEPMLSIDRNIYFDEDSIADTSADEITDTELNGQP